MQSKDTVKKNPKWNIDNLTKLSTGYVSRSDFAERNKPAYEAARVLKILDRLFPLLLDQWNDVTIREEAKKYTSRTDFAKGSGAAYNAARRLKILPELYDRLIRSWDEESIKQFAKQCSSKKDLKRKCASAYNAALRLKIIDQLFDNQTRINTRDCVYIWAVVDEPGLYKVGITSDSIGIHRVRQVEKASMFKADLLLMENIGYDYAKFAEKQMKRIGQKFVTTTKFYGHTEFRVMTTEELEQCFHIVKEYRERKNNS